MNKFELISEEEYEKTVAEEFKAKNGVLSYQKYDELKVPRRATQGSAGYFPVYYEASCFLGIYKSLGDLHLEICY